MFDHVKLRERSEHNRLHLISHDFSAPWFRPNAPRAKRLPSTTEAKAEHTWRDPCCNHRLAARRLRVRRRSDPPDPTTVMAASSWLPLAPLQLRSKNHIHVANRTPATVISEMCKSNIDTILSRIGPNSILCSYCSYWTISISWCIYCSIRYQYWSSILNLLLYNRYLYGFVLNNKT